MNSFRYPFHRIFSFLTAAALSVSLMPTAPVNAENTAVSSNGSGAVSISTAEDFSEFAKSCVLDSNTRNKQYILEADIALPADFKPIPAFCGIFDGNGYTISGLNLTASGSDTGLFRYVEKEGTVKNLRVTGRVVPSGSGKECGGIAGVNRGKIFNSSFSGMVSGKECCGGIAGVNSETGLIAACSSEGLVQARHYTGGIAGENLGTIINCTNNSAVNVTVFDESIDIENIDIEDIYSAENAADITDEGGIAGYSSGAVQSCKNNGNVGYIHVGYNVGGIVGRQDGYVSGCENYGVINGRKDVGGIVGQAEPHISLLFSERSVNKLRTQLDEMNAMIDKALNDANAQSSEISGDWDEICSRLEHARDTADDFLDITDDIINADIDAVNEISSRVTDLVDMAAPAAESFENGSDGMAEALDNLSEAAKLISEALDASDKGTDILFPVLSDMSDAVDSFSDASSSLDRSFEELQSSVGDEQQMENALQNISSSVQSMSASLGNISSTSSRLMNALNAFINDPAVDSDKQAIRDALDRLSEAAGRFSDKIKDTDNSWSGDFGDIGDIDDFTNINDYLENISDILSDESLGEIFDCLSEITEHLSNIISSEAAKNLDEELKKVSSDLGGELENLGSAGNNFSAAAGEANAQVNISGLFGFVNYLRQTNKDLGGSSGSADSIIQRITESWDYFDEASASLVAAVCLAEDASGSAKASSEDINDALSQIGNILEYFSGKSRIEFKGADESLISARNKLSERLGDIVNIGGDFGDTANAAVNVISDDLRLINGKAAEISDTLLDLADELSETSADISDYTEDISAEDSMGRSDGKIDRCKNVGQVNGDLCAGGIAGSMAVEYDFDPEGDIETVGSRSINFMYQSKTVIRDSENLGDVISKKGRAGGIAGEVSTGCLINCKGFGKVSSADGDYTGGVAGKSDAAIHGCSAKCRISGKNYVGGISGTAHDMINCKSFVVIEDGIERVGAIAGWSDFEGEVSGNTCIDGSGIGAVDGISYAGIAYPVQYDRMISIDDTPREFRSLTLTFAAEDDTVKTVDFSYGESLAESDIPAVPEVSGCFGEWEDFDYENMTFSATVNAVYTKYVTAIESAEKRENGLPVFVAEGSFTSSDALTAAENASDSGAEMWDITIPDDGAAEHILRYLPEMAPKRAIVTVTENGLEKTVKADIDGQYLVIPVNGNAFSIRLTEKSYSNVIISAAALAAAATAVLLIIIYRRKNKRPDKKPEKELVTK